MSNQVRPDREEIEIVAEEQAGEGAWTPIVGAETLLLLEKLPAESRNSVRDEALSVLSRCVPPSTTEGRETVLVVGYVQSGKTMSFTTVSTLARDNGYQLIIVITGTSVNLFNQSTGRIQDDLQLPDLSRGWKMFSNPTQRAGNARQSIESALQRWRDATVSANERQTVLITVMKNHRHLSNLTSLLSQLNLQGVPTLVIDDEADQAGLNNAVRQGTESSTYRRLVELREQLPQHTFIQYTATPQAPLLINLIDILSPRYAEVLTPGSTYTGGMTFFEQNLQLVRRIPVSDVPTRNNVLTEPPDSLLEAMRVFFVGVAAGMVLGSSPRNRSMMIHPSQKTNSHDDFNRWVTAIMNRWQRTLGNSSQDLDRQELIQDFQTAYNDLAQTAQNLPAFNAIEEKLPRAIRESVRQVVNASRGRTPQVEWNQDYSHILIGGTTLDRGFTVEGLTVTYMPRGRGVGNADTIQQRARWFGYKADYLGYCRIYLSDDSRDAYRSYVNHEEDVRERLRRHKETGRPLTEWRRAFFLDPALRPTRNDVLSLDYMRGNYTNKWFAPDTPHDSEDAIIENRVVVDEFLRSLSLAPDEGHPARLDAHRHLFNSDVRLSQAYEDLLTRFRLTQPGDSNLFFGLLMQVKNHLENNPDALCTIYQMRPDIKVPSYRGVNEKNEISNLFQGAYPVNPPSRRGEIYKGDQAIRSDQELTIQIHRLNEIRRGDGSQMVVIARDVPVIAVWVPRPMAAAWLIQDQGGDQ